MPDIVFNIEKTDNVYQIILETRIYAEKLGFSGVTAVLIATAVSELATNIIRYTKSGTINLSNSFKDKVSGIKIIAKDTGPGIRNVDIVMEDGYSTTKNSLGLGLSSVKRIMDDFSIESKVGIGTTIIVGKWL
ncbi:MAG: anti-sigma regulatory factor [Spirochaetaceae bacterium]